MQVKKSVQNQPPVNYSHLNLGRSINNSKLKLQLPKKSSQDHFKVIEQYKQNQFLLKKMLQIMDRPRITTVTSFSRDQKKLNQFLDRSFSSQNSAKSHNKARSPSASHLTPTSGKGPTSLNLSSRQFKQKEISRQNFRLVNSLCQVKPIVPVYEDLRNWSGKHKKFRHQIGTVRYGVPKPLKGLNIRMSVNQSFGKSCSKLSLKNQTPKYVKLVPRIMRPNSTQNSKILCQDQAKKSNQHFEAVYPNAINNDSIPSRYGNRPSKVRVTNVFDLSTSINEKSSNLDSSQKIKPDQFDTSPQITNFIRERNQSLHTSSAQTKSKKSNRINVKVRPKTSHQQLNWNPYKNEVSLETTNTLTKVKDTAGEITEISDEDGQTNETILPKNVRPNKTADGSRNPREELFQIQIRGQSGVEKNVRRIHNKFVSKRKMRNFEFRPQSDTRYYAATGLTTEAPTVEPSQVDFEPIRDGDDPYGAVL